MKVIRTITQLVLLSMLLFLAPLKAQQHIEISSGSTCNRIVSTVEDPTPAQIAGGTLPTIASGIVWQRPAISTSTGAFSGTSGSAAGHEGVDYIHSNQSIVEVVVRAAANGKVVYVRDGCDQSSMFEHNNTTREAGAGWGNHIVLSHKNAIYTRYGHLLKNSILVNNGDSVKVGQIIATMGNSGRSELRHLHFELGTKTTAFDPCAMSQNFDRVYNSELLNYTATDIKSINKKFQGISFYPNPFDKRLNLKINLEKESNLQIDLVDLTGRNTIQLFKGRMNEGDLDMNLSMSNKLDNIAQGIYFVKITSNQNSELFKLIKQN